MTLLLHLKPVKIRQEIGAKTTQGSEDTNTHVQMNHFLLRERCKRGKVCVVLLLFFFAQGQAKHYYLEFAMITKAKHKKKQQKYQRGRADSVCRSFF